MRNRTQFNTARLVKSTQYKRDDRSIINRTKRAAAGWAKGPARLVRGPPSCRRAAGASPLHCVRRKLYPSDGQSAGMSLAHFARAGVRPLGRTCCFEPYRSAKATAFVRFLFRHFLFRQAKQNRTFAKSGKNESSRDAARARPDHLNFGAECQSIALKLNSPPSLIPLGQRAVTVLVRV